MTGEGQQGKGEAFAFGRALDTYYRHAEVYVTLCHGRMHSPLRNHHIIVSLF